MPASQPQLFLMISIPEAGAFWPPRHGNLQELKFNDAVGGTKAAEQMMAGYETMRQFCAGPDQGHGPIAFDTLQEKANEYLTAAQFLYPQLIALMPSDLIYP